MVHDTWTNAQWRFHPKECDRVCCCWRSHSRRQRSPCGEIPEWGVHRIAKFYEFVCCVYVALLLLLLLLLWLYIYRWCLVEKIPSCCRFRFGWLVAGGGNETAEVTIIRDSRIETYDNRQKMYTVLLQSYVTKRRETNYSIKRTKACKQVK